MLQPKLRFLEFNTEWFERKLSELLIFKNGINASKEDYGSGYKFINVLDIINNDFITHDRIIGSVQIEESVFNKNIVEYGDVLFQRSSETREDVGQANVYLDKNLPATFGGFVIRGKKLMDYDPVFMNTILKTSRTRKEITSKSGGSTRYNVGQDTLGQVSIYIPELCEQQKIASFLSTVDEKIQHLKKQLSLQEQYKKGVMQKIFSREIRFKDENGNDFPEWEEKKLGEIGFTFNGLSGKTKEDFGKGMPYIQYKQIFDNSSIDISKCDFVEINDSDKQQRVKFGDVFFTVSSETPNEIGTASVLLENVDEMYLNSFCFGFRPNSINLTSPYFLRYLFRSSKFRSKIIKLAQGSTRYNMSKLGLLKLSEYFPAIQEQQKIASFLSSIDDKIEKNKEQIRKMELWKKGLLQQMFV